MSSLVLPGRISRGFYPERQVETESAVDRFFTSAVGRVGLLRRARASRFREIVPAVQREAERLRGMSEEELLWQVKALRPELRGRGFELDLVARAFALVREFSGLRIGMRHFDVQLIGGWVLLNGMVAEMQTGEGKTLVATLPAATLALAGVPVHVITVNDYLARRDAAWMGPLYEALGLSVGNIVQGMSVDDRRAAYNSDITYCTNKEIVFDYLRDRLDLGRKPGEIQSRLERVYGSSSRSDRLRLRGLCFAIVDEADSVLIDEARTPLIISGVGDNTYEVEVYQQALELGRQLESGVDYFIDFPKKLVTLNDDGKDRLEEIASPLGGAWKGRRRREELVRLGLTATELYHRDKHYVVKQGKVQIVDEYTGRIMPGRSWEGGLHQLIETKECCEVTTPTEVLGRISYQRFFRRYMGLAGMTGTAHEAAAEFWSVYRLPVVTVPPNRTMQRVELPMSIHATADAKWDAIVARIAELHAVGRPVLVGTRTVASSEHLAELLARADLKYRVLNAMQDEEEAEIVAQAGQEGKIMVATNMAGRGTDIKLEPHVRDLGGLHVIATELHDARRIDRQLFGRCGRQGDPGSFETFVSLEDELLHSSTAWTWRILKRRWERPGAAIPRLLGRALFRKAQRTAQRTHFHMRRELLRMDESVDSALAFSGRGE